MRVLVYTNVSLHSGNVQNNSQTHPNPHMQERCFFNNWEKAYRIFQKKRVQYLIGPPIEDLVPSKLSKTPKADFEEFTLKKLIEIRPNSEIHTPFKPHPLTANHDMFEMFISSSFLFLDEDRLNITGLIERPHYIPPKLLMTIG